MSRNVSIVVALLVIVVIAGYLVWLRSKIQPPISPGLEEQTEVTAPTMEPTIIASSSANPGKEATGTVKAKSATTGAVNR